MLTRLYIDNFRCFVNFEYRPARRQLIIGRNGSGKSSLMDALMLLRRFVVLGDFLDAHDMFNQRTRWLSQPRQTFELEASVGGADYVYRLLVEPWGDPPRPRVVEETVHFAGKPIFEFLDGEVHLYDDRLEHKVTYPFDWHRSALATITERKDNALLSQFKLWLSGLLFFRINPFAMGARAEKEDLYPAVSLSNIAAWYRHLVQADPKENAALLDSLRESLDAFSFLQLEPVGENVRLLIAEFANGNGRSIKFSFAELSEGQRCLVCLYTILHFVIAKGNTVILDEPDNFVALREIQPWLMSVTDAVEARQGQILLISHHPELINQWAFKNGVRLVRDGIGPVSVEEFHADRESVLSPSELVARGWENG